MQTPSSSRRRCAAGGLAAILAAALLLACQKKSPEEDLLHKVEPVGSWLASLQMAGEKWAANSLPSSFLRASLSAARKEFEKADEESAKSRARPEVTVPLRRLLAEAKAAGAGLERGVEAGDRAAVARQARQLAGLRARFETLQNAGKGP
ncbi:MAG TPA: hypothetical protein VF789_33085 [Thermoanaerobaculia bacterium]